MVENCTHEFVMTEYSSQPYGHCLGCGCTVVKDENNGWRLP